MQLFWIMALAFSADFSTYIGDNYTYTVAAITTDSSGNTYATGARAIGSSADVFVTKIDATGNVTRLATLAGKGSDEGLGIAVDASGNIFVAGRTTSPDFPLSHALQTASSSAGTGFLTKLAPDGSILFSTYLGGTKGSSALNAVALDAQGNAYVAGNTQAADYPSTAGLPADPVSNGPLEPISGAWFAKISADGSKILYAGAISSSIHECGAGSSCFLSAISTNGVAIAVDPAGEAFLAGNTYGGLSGTTGALVTSGLGAFVAKINSTGTALDYLTLLGFANDILGAFPNSSPANLITAIAVDSSGDAYLAGSTRDPNFPATSGAFQTQIPGATTNGAFPPSSAFAAKLNSTGSAMLWATYLGGTSNDAAQAMSVDPSGNVWLTGTTMSTDFPATLGFSTGAEFLAELNSSGSSLTYAARFPATAIAQAIAIDPSGTIHTAGLDGMIEQFSPQSAPAISGAPQILGVINSALNSPLAGRIVPGELISLYGFNLGPVMPAIAQVTNGLIPSTLAGVELTIDGFPAPLLYVSSTQINAVAPIELQPGSTVSLQLGSAPALRTVVDLSAPAVFLAADGFAAALNQDGSINSATNPATPGTIVAVWATGASTFLPTDGAIQQTAESYCFCQVAVQDGNALNVPYAGAAPGLVNGVVQINFQLPPTTSVLIPYTLTVASQTSPPFAIH